MSKSLKNFITIPGLLARHSADEFRMLVLRHHYRSPMDYSDATIAESKKILLSLRHFSAQLDFLLAHREQKKKSTIVHVPLDSFRAAFEEALADDMNTPKALSALFDLANAAHKQLFSLNKGEAKEMKRFLNYAISDIFGISLKIPFPSKEVIAIARERELSRNNKQFTHADLLRKRAETLGYVIEDTPLGPLVLPMS